MEPRKEILRLLPPLKRRGVLRVIFSRVGLMALILLLEVALLMGFWMWLTDYYKWLVIVQTLFSVAMVFYLFNCGMDATGKLTWMLLIMLFPVPAAILLWFTRRSIGQRMVRRRAAEMIELTRDMLPQDKRTIAKPEIVSSGTDDLCRYLNRSGCFPLYEHTQVTYYPSGEEKYRSILTELRRAKRFIYLEYFIIDEGEMWGSVLAILAEKAAEGVDVRVLYDGMCEVTLLPSDYPSRLKKLGIRCRPFAPITPFISTHYNYRDHRKILVIDGKVAYNGGVNLADEYINRVNRFGHWKDTALMLKGEAVQSFTLMFLQMWNMVEQEIDWHACQSVTREASDGFVMPFADCPLDGDKVGESVYMDILYRAKHYVHIMTPYLILDNELETALKYAAERGVDVKLILPGIPDKKVAYALAKSHYPSLLKAGVKLYEYTPGFVHAKVFVSDDEKAVVGTINLDYRSLYHHFECATYLYRTSCVGAIEKDFRRTMSRCRRVTEETVKGEKLYYKVTGAVMKLFAPLM